MEYSDKGKGKTSELLRALCSLFFITAILFSCISPEKPERKQTVPYISPFTWEMLRGTEWEGTNQHTYNFKFSDSIFTWTCKSAGRNDTLIYCYYYYLYDVIPEKFDFDRVGKNTSGQFIVLFDKDYKKYRKEANKIIYIGISKAMFTARDGERDTMTFHRKQ